jgi:hypothetical protein
MNAHRHKRAAFTLVELSIGATLLVVTLSLAMAGFVYFLRGAAQSAVQNELDIDVQTAMERVKYDLRLSSLDHMFYFPAGAVAFEAVSFPLARDDDGDGAVELNESGAIDWDKTHVYHVWSGEPEQLRLTTFDPRDNTLSDTERQEQIDSVVTVGGGSVTHNSANSSTTVIFENLIDWEVTPRGAIFDGYSTTLQRENNVFLGSIVLSNGTHDVKFEVIGKNGASSGYKVGVDSVIASPSYSPREGEAQTVASRSGATATSQYMTQGSWSGNYQLSFPATAVGHYFSLSLENDRWEETNFKGTGSLFDDTSVIFDDALDDGDFVVSLDGFGPNWYAKEQSGDLQGGTAGAESVRGMAVRVLIRGGDMVNGGWIQYNGGSCWVHFQAGSEPLTELKISDAYISECANQEAPSPDIDTSTLTRLTFDADHGIAIPSSSGKWTDLMPFSIDTEKSYIVSFLVHDHDEEGSAWKWDETQDPTMMGSYMIPAANAPTLADLTAATWSTRPELLSTNATLAVGYLNTTYPTHGLYTSQIIDTKQSAPPYSALTWNSYVPGGAALQMKIRSGNNDGLSDAAAWSNVTAMAAGGAINPGNKRYCQIQADLKPDASGFSTPKLLDATLRWTGVEKFVDVGGTFTKGPDYGVFKVTVDGREIKTGVVIDLEIFQQTRGYRGADRTVRSSLTSEVTPLNTGR